MAPPSTMPTMTTDAATAHSDGGGGEAFDRRRPLFEGTLPVEVVSLVASGASSREGQQFTVRVLRGGRGQHGGERVLRLEVRPLGVGMMGSFGRYSRVVVKSGRADGTTGAHSHPPMHPRHTCICR